MWGIFGSWGRLRHARCFFCRAPQAQSDGIEHLCENCGAQWRIDEDRGGHWARSPSAVTGGEIAEVAEPGRPSNATAMTILSTFGLIALWFLVAEFDQATTALMGWSLTVGGVAVSFATALTLMFRAPRKARQRWATMTEAERRRYGAKWAPVGYLAYVLLDRAPGNVRIAVWAVMVGYMAGSVVSLFVLSGKDEDVSDRAESVRETNPPQVADV